MTITLSKLVRVAVTERSRRFGVLCIEAAHETCVPQEIIHRNFDSSHQPGHQSRQSGRQWNRHDYVYMNESIVLIY
jgi:hypothetical protein